MIKKDLKNDYLIIIISFLVGALFMYFLVKINMTSHSIIKNNTQIFDKSSLAASVDKIYDAVVVVEGFKNDAQNNTGTGFVYKVEGNYGYILTNEHVLKESDRIIVVMSNDEEVEVEVLGKDEFLDLAVLRINKKHVSLVATIGKSEDMNLGDTVFTVGSPIGYNYRGSVTSGILSGKDRMVATSTTSSSDSDWLMRVLQFDASINPGNSGGPLLNVNGEVIGICSMKLIDDEIEGMSFAIPIEYAMNHVNSLENKEKIKWPSIGITMANVEDKAKLYRNDIELPNNVKDGVVILEVKKNSSSATAGLKRGDIITKVDGKSTKDIAYLRYELYQHQSGEKIEIEFIRNGKTKKQKITLSDKE